MQNKDHETDFFTELKQIFRAPCTMVAGIFRLACLEMRLAKKSVVVMVCLFFLLLVVGITFWLGINILLVIYLLSFGFLFTHALLVLILFNMFLGAFFMIFFAKFSRTVTFSATRKQLISLRGEQNVSTT